MLVSLREDCTTVGLICQDDRTEWCPGLTVQWWLPIVSSCPPVLLSSCPPLSTCVLSLTDILPHSVSPVAASGQLKCKGGPGGEGQSSVMLYTCTSTSTTSTTDTAVHQHRYRPALWQLSHHILWSLSSGLTLGRITQECQLWMLVEKPLDFLWYLALIECTVNSIYSLISPGKQLIINKTPHCPLLKKIFPQPFYTRPGWQAVVSI